MGLRILMLAIAATVVACGGDVNREAEPYERPRIALPPSHDGGVRSAIHDAGVSVAPDAGAVTDSGVAHEAGTEESDAGGETDAGDEGLDAGEEVDAGREESDAGGEADAGGEERDAGDTDAGSIVVLDGTCDGIDDDLDGIFDEDFVGGVSVCGAGACMTFGATSCVDGETQPNCAAPPVAVEVCNDVDDDCDGAVDEGLKQRYFADLDGDGRGTAFHATDPICAPPAGFVVYGDDCDEWNRFINPGEPDVCNDVDDDCDGEADNDPAHWVAAYQDSDGDGFGGDPVEGCAFPGTTLRGGDCADWDPLINPDIPEFCDEIDQDCDEEVDEDVVDRPLYLDSDFDGFGSGEPVETSCLAFQGRSHRDDDCNDEDANVRPGAIESCNVVDDDCDGTVDEEGSDPQPLAPDDDGDSQGDVRRMEMVCGEAPAGWQWAFDCNDADANVYAGAIETCNGIDDDCNGLVDDGSAQSFVAPDDDGDGHGDKRRGQVICGPPPDGWAPPTDCDDLNADVSPNAREICNHIDDNCDGVMDEGFPLMAPDDDHDDFGDMVRAERFCDAIPAGYRPPTDCDDADPTLNPDTYWYRDDDGDRFGDTTRWKQQCTLPAGTWSRTGGDCRVDDEASYPGAPEVCANQTRTRNERIDNNCNGIVDEGCPRIHCGLIEESEIWDATEEGHLITCDVRVQDNRNRPVLTITSGAVVRFERGTSLLIAPSESGGLIVAGGGAGVSFTSAASEPSPGDYEGILIGEYALDGTQIVNATIEYGGGDGASGNLTIVETEVALERVTSAFSATTGVFIDHAPTTIRNLTANHNGTTGILIDCSLTGSFINCAPMTIRDSFANHNGTMGVFIDSAELTIRDSFANDNGTTGIYCSDDPCLAQVEEAFAHNEMTRNGEYPIRLFPDDVVALDSESSFAGNTRDFISIAPGTVTRSAAWSPLGASFRAEGMIGIHAVDPPTLELTSGVEIYFELYAGLRVGASNYSNAMRGALLALGPDGEIASSPAEERIVLTSIAQDPEPGDWFGIHFTRGADESELVGVDLSYAGALNENKIRKGGVYVTTRSPVRIEGSSFSFNAGDGLELEAYGDDLGDSNSLVIVDSAFFDNSDTGVEIEGKPQFLATFTGNVMERNGIFPISLPSISVHQLDTTSRFTGNIEEDKNGDDYVRITEGGALRTEQTWFDLGVPYFADCDIVVGGPGAPTLTLHNNVEIAFGEAIRAGDIWKFRGLNVGSGGHLEAIDDRLDGFGIELRGRNRTAGSWAGVIIEHDDASIELAGVNIFDGGGDDRGSPTTTDDSAGLYLARGFADLFDTWVDNSRENGIYVDQGVLAMADSIVTGTVASADSNGDGVYTFHGNSSVHAEIVSWERNSIYGNERYPLSIGASIMAMIGKDTRFVDLDGGSPNGVQVVYVQPNSVAFESGTWQRLDVPWRIGGEIGINGPAHPVITAEDFAVFEFMGNSGMYIADEKPGDFIANNCLFTSAERREPGGWNGIFTGTASRQSDLTRITNSRIEYAGADRYAANTSLLIYRSHGTFTGNTIAHSLNCAIRVAESENAIIEGNILIDAVVCRPP